MDKRKKFFETWKDQFGIVSTSVCSLILIALEKIMEVEFKCPAKKNWRVYYSLSYFLIPAVVLFLLTVIFLPIVGQKRDPSCSLLKALVPSLIWMTLLLLDGRYFSCPCEIFRNESITATSVDQPTECYIISQISGLVFIFVVGVIFFIQKKWLAPYCTDEDESNKAQGDTEMGVPLSTKQKCVQAVVTDVLEPRLSECVDKVWAVMQAEGNRSPK
nr:uncharacterized protein LOC112544654 isoform X1 [Pelodiscus sinensis]XP_025037035.1 uncharacterized protein LOC112544654 isoform X2 [Pelodiscus sinensis]|eukprot:XP_025037034.1 uncharacterized protein LOC112544654 isoform X1 [Pelodiscus sinensis]